MTTPQKISIIGPGKVGTALAKLIDKTGKYQISIAGRNTNRVNNAANFIGDKIEVKEIEAACAWADIILLTVGDDVIETLCNELAQANAFANQAIVVHCSGALPSSILKAAKISNHCEIASLHPLQTFPSVESAIKNLPGTYCFYEGSEQSLSIIKTLIEDIRLNPILIDAQAKTLYHAAAVMACNYFTALMDAALEVGQNAGIEPTILWQGLSPLVAATLDNLDKSDPATALTGPIARGDTNTIHKHLEKLAELDTGNNHLMAIYTALGKQTIDLAVRKGNLSLEKSNELNEILAKSNP